jgi:hypothetical protein
LGYTPEKFRKEMAYEYWKGSSLSINTDFHSRSNRQSNTLIKRSRLSPRFYRKAMELETVFVRGDVGSELAWGVFSHSVYPRLLIFPAIHEELGPNQRGLRTFCTNFILYSERTSRRGMSSVMHRSENKLIIRQD